MTTGIMLAICALCSPVIAFGTITVAEVVGNYIVYLLHHKERHN